MIFVFRNLREHDISNKRNNTLLSQLSETYFYNRTRTDQPVDSLSQYTMRTTCWATRYATHYATRSALSHKQYPILSQIMAAK